MGGLRVAVVEGAAPSEAVALRRRVFVEEQGVAEGDEIDGRDAQCVHFVAWQGEEPVGCGRLRPLGEGRAKIERVAVQGDLRGLGVGRRVMDEMEAEATRRSWTQLVLHAQLPVVSFYERLGWSVVGTEFEEAGIRHRAMEKTVR
jgi:predicted GNAT family N-acyltransferase